MCTYTIYMAATGDSGIAKRLNLLAEHCFIFISWKIRHFASQLHSRRSCQNKNKTER